MSAAQVVTLPHAPNVASPTDNEDDADDNDAIGNVAPTNGAQTQNANEPAARVQKAPKFAPIDPESIDRRVTFIRQEKKYDLLLHM